MTRRNLVCRPSFLLLLILLIAVVSSSCGFCVTGTGCPTVVFQLPLSEVTSPDPIKHETPGTIVFYHGSGCSESNRSGRETVLRVEGSAELPAYATNATVFLNGWHAKYLSDDDHHVTGFLTVIENIRREGNVLKWDAKGMLSDDDFDDGYRWCYFYTVVAWNPSILNLTVDHEGEICDMRDPLQSNTYAADDNGTTALSSYPSFLSNPNFSRNVAVLPRGFGLGYGDGCDRGDYHLLQAGYNLVQTETFIQSGKKYFKDTGAVPMLPENTARVSSGFVSWETSAIIKDNKAKRDYTFGETVSGLSGKDVGIIQPPYAILPIEDSGFTTTCIGSVPPSREFVIENIPFDFAIPMLTGWDLQYVCEDKHVKELGIWIDEWRYEKAPNAPSGTLRYTLSSRLTDDEKAGHYVTHKVTVLGLRPAAGVIPFGQPDLVPFSPLGTGMDAFCRFEQNGTQLRVTVKNQGNTDAPASKTTVLFPTFTLVRDTPPIPAGGSVDVVFVGTAACSFDCLFTIRVDSANQVNEPNNELNNSANGRCIG